MGDERSRGELRVGTHLDKASLLKTFKDVSEPLCLYIKKGDGKITILAVMCGDDETDMNNALRLRNLWNDAEISELISPPDGV